MYARTLTINLKPNRLNDFNEILDKQVIPMLRKQPGFKDAISFANTGGAHVRVVSFWDSKEQAETYNSTTYSEVLKILANVVDGTPQIKTYDVVTSTFHKIPAMSAV
jgi:heme-degrading monooxygenase HmoA